MCVRASLGVAGVSLETVFSQVPTFGFLRSLKEQLDDRRLEKVLAWGHPDGLQCGKSPAAVDGLRKGLSGHVARRKHDAHRGWELPYLP